MIVPRGSGKRWTALAGRLLLAATLAAPVNAATALAASATKPAPQKPAVPLPAKKVTTPAQRCTDLESQFDLALPKHGDAKGLTAAKKLRADGQHLCDTGQHAAGALRLARALVALDVKPDAN